MKPPADAPAPTLSHAEVRALIARAQAGDTAAKERLVEANLRLVGAVARRFSAPAEQWDDLFQSGCIGLIKAIDAFDLRFDVKLSTYAVPYILGEIKGYLRAAHPLKLPRTVLDVGRRAADARDRLAQALGRSPTPQEVAAEMGLPKEEVLAALDALAPVASLHQPVFAHDESPRTLAETIEAEEPRDTLDAIALRETLSRLSAEDRHYVILRFFKRHTQVEVAQILQRSQAHVSRMEARIRKRLRILWYA